MDRPLCNSFQEQIPSHPHHLQTKHHTRPCCCKGLKNKMSSWSHGWLANHSDHLPRQMSQQKVPFAKDGPIGMIRSFTKTRYCHLPSLLQEPIQAHPDHLQKPNVLPNCPLCKDLQKLNVIMYVPLYNWLASPHSSNHLQRQISQRTVPFTKDGPIQMIQIICKNKVLSLAILFA